MRPLLTLVLVVLALTGCMNSGGFPLCYVDLNEPSAPVSESSINESEDVISRRMDNMLNVGKLDEFIARKNGHLRVVQYTVEGDPIFDDLKYEDGRIQVRSDDTLDTYGDSLIDTYSCSSLSKEETDTRTVYVLSGCDGQQERVELFGFWYELTDQRTFEFVLQYGYGHGNVIDTVGKRLVKDLLNGEVAEVNDFELTPEERRTIYKAMVLANFQMPKELTVACNMKPHIRYDLKVKTIHSNYRYQWSECDQSRDGEAMTGLVNTIIEVVQARKEYQELPPVQGGVQ
jgi:hypothetical protein